MINTVARISLVLVVLLTLQTTVLAEPLLGARADLLLLFAIAVGLAEGADRGAMFGFLAGFLLDLVVHGTPVGFFALGFTVVGYVTGVVQHAVLRTAWWIPVLSAFVASALGVCFLAVVYTMLGQNGLFDRHLLTIAAVVSVVNAILILPMMRIVRWALPPAPRPGRLAI